MSRLVIARDSRSNPCGWRHRQYNSHRQYICKNDQREGYQVNVTVNEMVGQRELPHTQGTLFESASDS